MIKKIEIKNFKSILSAKIETGSLNLFTGINGSGKSTILQALLLLRQSYLGGNLFREPISLKLTNGVSLVSLGTFKDILCQQAKKGSESITLKLDFIKNNLIFISEKYSVENRDLNLLRGTLNQDIFKFENEKLFTDRCQYLGAERIEPKEDYPRYSQSNDLLGKRGEFTAHYIEMQANDDIPIKQLSLHETPTSYTFINQLNNWMGEISDSIEIITNENLKTNRIELAYRYKQADGTPSQNQKPQNVGYGITHTLPIVVAILSAKPDDIIIIENPETHLHPKSQSRLSHLFALAAQNGIQLFIETHSDHIINGIRVAVKKNLIDNNNIFLYYFSKTNKNISDINRILVQQEGELNIWPPNFFDQATKDLNYLFGI